MKHVFQNITPARTRKGRAGLHHVAERENSAMGVLLALEPPTKGMLSESASAGRFQLPGAGRTYPKVQIFTVEDYFVRRNLHAPIGGPRHTSDTLMPKDSPRQKAKRIQKDTGQRRLEL